MSVYITAECISCGACLPECPNEAIFENPADCESKEYKMTTLQTEQGPSVYVISHERCTECVGHFDEPQCAAVCPVDNCCISDTTYPEPRWILLAKAKRLNPEKHIDDNVGWANVREEEGLAIFGTPSSV